LDLRRFLIFYIYLVETFLLHVKLLGMKNIFKTTVLLILLNITTAEAQNTYTYTGKPIFKVSVTRANSPIGSFTMELFPNIAPRHTRNFDSLTSVGFYDSTAFHRVVPGFVIQGGDPNSKNGPPSTWGQGNPNQPTVKAEFSAARHLRGIVSAARSSNINSATSQFFVCVAAASNLNGQYSAYGRVTNGMNIVDNIVASPRDASDRPLQKVAMYVSYIGSNDTVPLPPTLITPPNDSMELDVSAPIFLKWNPVSDGIIYELEVSTSPNFIDTVAFVKTASLVYSILIPEPSTIYYWRLRTNNGGHFSAYSPTRRFFTQWDYTGITSTNLNNTGVQVFPNPSNGKFKLCNLKRGDLIEVFSIEGKLISSSTTKDNEFYLDIESSGKGLYSYKVSNNNVIKKQGKLFVK